VDNIFVELCQFSPCENGATCIFEEKGSTFTCLCVPGYVGKICDTGKLCDVFTREWNITRLFDIKLNIKV